MITGIGTDLLEIDRIASVFSMHGERFLQRILTPNEQREASTRTSIANYLAKQFSAKEAISKALGVGIGKLSFQDIEILRDDNGKPQVKLSKKANIKFAKPVIHISLTDTKKTVMAFCVVERTETSAK